MNSRSGIKAGGWFTCSWTLLLLCSIVVTFMIYWVAFDKNAALMIPKIYASLSRSESRPADFNSSKDFKILCFVLSNNAKRLKAVTETWGQRFDKLIFIVSKEAKIKDNSNVVKLNVREGRDHLTAKSRQAIMYVYEHYLDSFDWFMKADDDTFVIVDNLRLLLAQHSPNESVKFGHYSKYFRTHGQGYNGGGAGYVMSRAAIKAVVEKGFKVKGRCREDGGSEDVEIGKCLAETGAKQYSSLDTTETESFIPTEMIDYLMGTVNPTQAKDWSRHPQKMGPGCCSTYMISMHRMPPNEMYIYYHLLYRTKVWGEKKTNEHTPVFVKKKETDILPKK